MFVVSLNFDIFFKKVFSNKKIAKNFLQDFFGVKITEIKILKTDYKVTDDATVVRFDYRCKINGKYVVIEMQQKYKTDVNKRFYLYHCLGTALQLETLKPKVVTQLKGKTYTEKSYGDLEPVITLIWMVDDTLNFTEDFIAFTTLPEASKDFILNEDLWHQPLDVILKERENAIKILKNNTKDLDFFSQNRLIYAFQRNIIANGLITKYFKWFSLAHKSRNINNTEKDFSQFNDDEIMVEVIKRIEKDKLTANEYKFISDMPLFEAYYSNIQQDLEKKLQEERQKTQKEHQLRKEEHQLRKEEQQLRREEQQLRKEDQRKLLISIENLLRRGDTIESIADLLVRSVEEITAFVAQIEAKKA